MGNRWTKRSITLGCAVKAIVNRLPIGCMACATNNRNLTNLRRRHWWKPARNMESGGDIDGECEARSMEKRNNCIQYRCGLRCVPRQVGKSSLPHKYASRYVAEKEVAGRTGERGRSSFCRGRGRARRVQGRLDVVYGWRNRRLAPTCRWWTTRREEDSLTSFRFIHTADIHLDSPLRGLTGQEGSAAERIRVAPERRSTP